MGLFYTKKNVVNKTHKQLLFRCFVCKETAILENTILPLKSFQMPSLEGQRYDQDETLFFKFSFSQSKMKGENANLILVLVLLPWLLLFVFLQAAGELHNLYCSMHPQRLF